MTLFLEGAIELVSKSSFTDKQTGDEQVRFKHYVKNDEGEVIVLNSKKDFSSVKNVDGVARIGVYEINDRPGFYLTLLDFVPQTVE
jgi:hypothetical protein